jgi:hypothetical protein
MPISDRKDGSAGAAEVLYGDDCWEQKVLAFCSQQSPRDSGARQRRQAGIHFPRRLS